MKYCLSVKLSIELAKGIYNRRKVRNICHILCNATLPLLAGISRGDRFVLLTSTPLCTFLPGSVKNSACCGISGIFDLAVVLIDSTIAYLSTPLFEKEISIFEIKFAQLYATFVPKKARR